MIAFGLHEVNQTHSIKHIFKMDAKCVICDKFRMLNRGVFVINRPSVLEEDSLNMNLYFNYKLIKMNQIVKDLII